MRLRVVSQLPRPVHLAFVSSLPFFLDIVATDTPSRVWPGLLFRHSLEQFCAYYDEKIELLDKTRVKLYVEGLGIDLANDVQDVTDDLGETIKLVTLRPNT